MICMLNIVTATGIVVTICITTIMRVVISMGIACICFRVLITNLHIVIVIATILLTTNTQPIRELRLACWTLTVCRFTRLGS